MSNRIWSMILASVAAMSSWCAIHTERVQKNTNWVLTDSSSFSFIVWGGTSRTPSWNTVVAKWFVLPSDDSAMTVLDTSPRQVDGPTATKSTRLEDYITWIPNADLSWPLVKNFPDADGLAPTTLEQREAIARFRNLSPGKVSITWASKARKSPQGKKSTWAQAKTAKKST